MPVLVAHPHPVFNMVEVGHEVDDAGGISFLGVESFGEAAPNVGHAASKFDVLGVVFLIGGVDSVAVDLEESCRGLIKTGR